MMITKVITMTRQKTWIAWQICLPLQRQLHPGVKDKQRQKLETSFLNWKIKKNKLLETKYNKKQTSDDMVKDDDYHFFMSPEMKIFTNIQKLRIRIKLL